MKNILIVEDEANISDFVKGELEYEGYNVCIKEDGREGLEEAVAIDNGIKELLNKHNVKYIEYAQNVAVKTIVNDILNYLKYGNELWKQMTS